MARGKVAAAGSKRSASTLDDESTADIAMQTRSKRQVQAPKAPKAPMVQSNPQPKAQSKARSKAQPKACDKSGMGSRAKSAKASVSTETSRETWFAEYQDFDRTDGKQIIAPAGFQQLCETIGYDIESMEPLVLQWKLGGGEFGTIEWSQWDRTLREMNVANINELKSVIDAAVQEFDNNAILFRDFYRNVFDIIRPPKHKSVPAETVKGVMPVVTRQQWLFMRFVAFLDARGDTLPSINRDQWQSLLELSKTVDKDFSNYSKEDAWPILFDEFYDWARQP